MINRGGPAFVRRLQDSSGRPAADVARAFTAVRDGFVLAAVYREIDALDNKVDGTAQLDFYQTCGRLIEGCHRLVPEERSARLGAGYAYRRAA